MEMFRDANGKLSAKRIIGGIGLILTILVGLVILVLSIFPNNNIDPLAVGLIATMAGLCSGLIGVGVLEKKVG